MYCGGHDLSQDPHDYQATATDKLNITKSAVMLVNGGGYDDWGMSLAESVSHKPVVINAVALSGLSLTRTMRQMSLPVNNTNTK